MVSEILFCLKKFASFQGKVASVCAGRSTSRKAKIEEELKIVELGEYYFED